MEIQVPSHPGVSEFLQLKEVYISTLIGQKSFLSLPLNDSMGDSWKTLALVQFTSNYKLYYCEATATAKLLQITIKEVHVSNMYIVLYSTSCSRDDAEFITDVENAIEIT